MANSRLLIRHILFRAEGRPTFTDNSCHINIDTALARLNAGDLILIDDVDVAPEHIAKRVAET